MTPPVAEPVIPFVAKRSSGDGFARGRHLATVVATDPISALARMSRWHRAVVADVHISQAREIDKGD